jgi:cob(I)alamin adenosyltransferase
MVVLNRIYTRSGDTGTSSLASGETLPKSDLRFHAIGTVDEANAFVGLARLHIGLGIQNDLFDLGADLATARTDEAGALRITDAQVERLEREIDALNAGLEPLRSFVLPAGSPAAVYLHICRTVTRRAEREMVALSGTGQPINGAALRYINRLSDLFFVAARVANDGGRGDVLWRPGQNR